MKLFKYETEEEQLKAVKKDGNEIAYIHNPSEKVQLEAVKVNSRAIQFIDNPSEEAQLEAVKHDTAMIEFIHNPTEKVIRYVINNPSNKFIKYEDIMYILFAKIGKEGYDKLSDEDKVKSGFKTTKLFQYETEEEQLEAVRKHLFAAARINNPSEKVQLAIVKRHSELIRYIRNPSEEAQLEAVRQCGYSIVYINNPTEKVIKYLLDNYSSNIVVMQLLSARIGKDWYDKLSDEDKLRLELEDN